MKPEKFVERLKLDTGFEEEKIEFNLSKSIVLRASNIIIGRITLLSEIPAFVRDIFILWRQKNIKRLESSETGHFVYYAAVMTIYCLLILLQRRNG